VVGKNFDWHNGNALIVVNKRNVTKTAYLYPDRTGGQPAGWISKYGSATVNFLGREFPFSGMNEAGLVISGMMLSLTEYPAPDARPAIWNLQWMQYQLDTAATVADVIASDTVLRISNSDLCLPAHFFVCDSQGHCASIEFLDGVLVYHTQETMPVKVLTNNIYSTDLEYWENEEIPVPDVYSSAQRFCTATEMLEDYDPETSRPATDYTFNILSDLTWNAPTQWSIAYDVQHRRISFHTLDNANIRYFDMNSFDFSCQTPVRVLDIQEDLSGNVAGDFIDYTYELNRTLISKTRNDAPDEVLDALAYYPETLECAGACALDVKHKKIHSSKLFKPRRVVLKISGDDDFDMYSQSDLGPLTWRKKSFNRKKNRLKVQAIVPAGLRPGTVPIWVGSCFGEIEVLP
jgi:choloylglycine hydrolase